MAVWENNTKRLFDLKVSFGLGCSRTCRRKRKKNKSFSWRVQKTDFQQMAYNEDELRDDMKVGKK